MAKGPQQRAPSERGTSGGHGALSGHGGLGYQGGCSGHGGLEGHGGLPGYGGLEGHGDLPGHGGFAGQGGAGDQGPPPPEAGAPAVVAVFGPTGIGKTEIAIELADRLRERGEDPVAISADALQVYRGLETLTGAPSPTERARLEHRLVGFVPAHETFSVGRFMPLAHGEIDAALAAGQRPIVVGGTGLYLRAALTDLALGPPPPKALRRRLEEELHARGPEALHRDLEARAGAAAARIAPTDRRRIVRALERLELGAAEPAAQENAADSELWAETTRHPTLLLGLVMRRAALYQRIDARVDAIVAAGAEEEVRLLSATGVSETAAKALGFEELLAGDVEALKRRTRNYAKRQLTWMRKLGGVVTVDVTGRPAAEVAGEIAPLI